MKRALIATATMLSVAACSTSTPGGKPAPSSSAPGAGLPASVKYKSPPAVTTKGPSRPPKDRTVWLPDNKNVLKFPAGSTNSSALPFKGLNGPRAVAVDGAGGVYVLDNSGFGQVVKLVLG
jgi:hypothetical protein